MLIDIELLSHKYIHNQPKKIQILKYRYLTENIEIRHKQYKACCRYRNPRWIDKIPEICKLVKIKLHEGDEIEFVRQDRNGKNKFIYYKLQSHKLKKIYAISSNYKFFFVEIARLGGFDYH